MNETAQPLFTAITFGAATNESLVGLIGNLHSYASWESHRPEPPERLHLTLNYQPKVANVNAVAAALAKIDMQPFTLGLSHLGLFQNSGQEVIWMGVDGEIACLIRLKDAVDAAFTACGHPPLYHTYRPHITLAYAEGAQLTGPATKPLPEGEGSSIRVESFHLMRVAGSGSTTKFERLYTFTQRN